MINIVQFLNSIFMIIIFICAIIMVVRKIKNNEKK